MAGTPTHLPESRLGSTLRRDSWWIELLPVIILLGGFGLYATLRAFEGAFYDWGPYLSPFYSPLIDPQHHWWKFSPALLILAGPLRFRATCYYYRKAYYRAFFLDPPACAVGEPANRKYRGETAFPFILQNLHRYFLYLAIIFLAFLCGTTRIEAFFFDGQFGIGVGTPDSARQHHLAFDLHPVVPFAAPSCRRKARLFFLRLLRHSREHAAWRGFSFLNERHMLFAWISLISVGFADFYIRLVASGAIHDVRISVTAQITKFANTMF